MEETFLDLLAPDVRAEALHLGVVRRHRRGRYLMMEGDRNDQLILLREGRVKIVCTADDGKEVLVAVLGPGELVGELNALAGVDSLRAASVIALDDVVVQTVGAGEFLSFLRRHPDATFGLLKRLGGRLREATARHATTGGYDVVHRVARVLIDAAGKRGRPIDAGGLLVSEGLSQADLAGLIAASPKSVARALSLLRARGLISTARRSIVVLDLPGLRRFVG